MSFKEKEAINRSFNTDFLSNFLSSILLFIFSIMANILIARSVGAEGKGLLALVILAMGQSQTILSLGIGWSIIYYVGRSKLDPRDVASTSFALSLPLGFLAMFMAIGISQFLIKDISSYLSVLILIFALLLPLSLFSSYLSMIARAKGRIAEISILDLIKRLISFSGILVCFFFARSVFAILIVYIVTNTLFIIIWMILATRWGYLPLSIKRVHKTIAYQIITYGLKAHGGTILQSFNYRFDMYVVAYFLSAYQVGIYSIAVGLCELPLMLPESISIILTQRAASRNWKAANRITTISTRLTLLALAIACLVLVLIGPFIIYTLYGNSFSESSKVLPWLLPGIWFMGLWKNLHNDIGSRGYPIYKTYSSGLACVATLILDFALIPRYGLIGSALASSFAYGIAALSILIPYCRITGVRAVELLLPKISDIKHVISLLSHITKFFQHAFNRVNEN